MTPLKYLTIRKTNKALRIDEEKENQTMRKEVKLDKDTKRIFELAQGAHPYVHKDINGDYVTENVGSYCAFISRDMVREMSTLSLLLMSKYPELGKNMKEASEVLRSKDLTICRMLDDIKAERELSDYRFDDTESVVIMLKSAKENDAFLEKPFDFYIPKFREWVDRFIKLDVMAYYLNCKDHLSSALNIASMRAFDDDGNQVFGISSKEEESVKQMVQIETLMLHALIRLPVHSNELSICMEKIERMEWLIEAVSMGKHELLEHLLRYADAARDFEDTEN